MSACKCAIVVRIGPDKVRCQRCGETYALEMWRLIQRGQKIVTAPVKAWGFKKEREEQNGRTL